MVILRLYLIQNPFFVYVSNEGSDETARMRRTCLSLHCVSMAYFESNYSPYYSN